MAAKGEGGIVRCRPTCESTIGKRLQRTVSRKTAGMSRSGCERKAKEKDDGMKLLHLTTLSSALLALNGFAGPADVTVTKEMLLSGDMPAMTVLDHDGSGDWTSVGETQKEEFNKEPAHLNEDGELVLVDDAGFQYHAVWASSCPVKTDSDWSVSFRYIPVPNPNSAYCDAGGWTFVMQNQGPTAYGVNSPLLGVPASGAYGFMFHRYYLGVRWIKNSNVVNTWSNGWDHHIIGTNKNNAIISFDEGLDLDMESPMDVTIGCTNRIWTVTMRQEGKQDIVLSHDFGADIRDDSATYHLGFTGASSWWNVKQFPVMYQKIAGFSGAVSNKSGALTDAGPLYALSEKTWKTGDDAEFVGEGRLLVLNPSPDGDHRYFCAAGQAPLCREMPFSLSFEWVCESGMKGAQGVSFSLVPSNVPQRGESLTNPGGDFYYPGDASAAGFCLRPYGNSGFAWHKGGERDAFKENFTNITTNDVMNVTVDWNGDDRMVVAIGRNGGVRQVFTNHFDNLPEVFYPAFHGSSAKWREGITRFVAQNYAMQVSRNPFPVDLGDVEVTGAREYNLSTCSPSADLPSAKAGTVSLGADASLSLTPAETNLGGSLFASNIAVEATSSITSVSPCALKLSRLSYSSAAKLTLSGRVIVGDGTVRIRCSKKLLSTSGRHKLVDASAATGLEDAVFVLEAAEGQVQEDRVSLVWDGEILKLVVRGGLLMSIR